MKRFAIILSALLLAACKPDAYLGPLDSPVGNWEGYKGEYFFDGELVAELDSCEFKGISFYKQGFCCIEGVKGAFSYVYNESNGDLQIDSTLWHVPTLTGAEMIMEFVDRIYPPEPEPEPEPEPAPEPENPEGENPEGGDPEGGDEGSPEETPETEEPGHGSGADPETDPEQPEEPEKPEEPAEPEVKPDKNGVILPAEYKGFTIEANKNGYFYMNAAGKKVYCGFKGWKNEADSLIIDFWYDSSTNYFVPMVVEVTKK